MLVNAGAARECFAIYFNCVRTEVGARVHPSNTSPG